jgi:hypothetical protein
VREQTTIKASPLLHTWEMRAAPGDMRLVNWCSSRDSNLCRRTRLDHRDQTQRDRSRARPDERGRDGPGRRARWGAGGGGPLFLAAWTPHAFWRLSPGPSSNCRHSPRLKRRPDYVLAPTGMSSTLIHLMRPHSQAFNSLGKDSYHVDAQSSICNFTGRVWRQTASRGCDARP